MCPPILREFLDNSVTEATISKLFSRTQEELSKHKNFKKEIEKILFDKADMSHVKT